MSGNAQLPAPQTVIPPARPRVFRKAPFPKSGLFGEIDFRRKGIPVPG